LLINTRYDDDDDDVVKTDVFKRKFLNEILVYIIALVDGTILV
jgi:hypothetical protein